MGQPTLTGAALAVLHPEDGAGAPETYEQAFSRLVRNGWPPDLAHYALDEFDAWAARHNTETWHWRSGPDGFYK